MRACVSVSEVMREACSGRCRCCEHGVEGLLFCREGFSGWCHGWAHGVSELVIGGVGGGPRMGSRGVRRLVCMAIGVLGVGLQTGRNVFELKYWAL